MKTIVWTIIILVIVVAMVLGGGCNSCATDPEATVDTLEKAGYTNPTTGGYALFACGEGDFYHTEFIATNPLGKKVKGVVCCGLIAKACTIRF